MPTLSEAVHTYINLDRAPTTNATYTQILTRAAVSLGPDRDIRLITTLDLLDYVRRLHEGRSPSTVDLHARVLRGLFSWCVTLGLIEMSPAANVNVRVPSTDPSKSRAIPTAVLRQMIDLASTRDRAILLFFADTGCRLGGIVTLTIPRLNLPARSAMLHEKGDRYYWVDYGDTTAAALTAWLAQRPKSPSDAVFIGPRTLQALHHESVASMVANLSKKVCGQAYRPHSIRHWVGETWAEAGESVYTIQGKLGHRHQRTTERYFPRRSSKLAEATQRRSINHLIDEQNTSCKIIEVDFAS